MVKHLYAELRIAPDLPECNYRVKSGRAFTNYPKLKDRCRVTRTTENERVFPRKAHAHVTTQSPLHTYILISGEYFLPIRTTHDLDVEYTAKDNST